MAILLQDDFNRADSTTSLGSPLIGGPYTVRSGTFGISTNRAYNNPAVAGSHVTFPAAANVDYQFVIPVTPTTSSRPQAVIRWVDASNFVALDVRAGSGIGQILIMVAGTFHVMADFAVTAVAGDTYRFQAYGEDIVVYRNGSLLARAKDPKFATATVAGFRGQGSTAPYWDDLLVQDQAAPIFADWGPSAEATDGIDLDFDAEMSIAPSLYKGRDTAIADESEIP